MPVVDSKHRCSVFTDAGSDSSYITDSAAKRLGAKKLNKYMIEVTTTGGQKMQYESQEYQIGLVTKSGKIATVQLYGINKITGLLSKLNLPVVKKLFPSYDTSLLQRDSSEVDILL